MESRFGHDLDRVRIHTDRAAAEAAAALGVPAFSTGDHVVFGEDRYAPARAEGRWLLAHEIAHVVQRGRATPFAAVSTLEDDARHAADQVAAGRDADVAQGAAPAQLLCAPPNEVSVELAGAPTGKTAEERVQLWLVQQAQDIQAAEAIYSVDRRAIAGAIAWEALNNVWGGTWGNLARFSGPGKVHYKENRFSEGNPVAKQVEDLGSLPAQSMEGRRTLLAQPTQAIIYIAAIMDAFAGEAATAGYDLRCNPAMLASFYNAWDLPAARALFATKRYPAPLTPNPDMGSWVQKNLAYLEAAVGKPSSLCPPPPPVPGPFETAPLP